ncbi:MAG: GNAT family N-acetyltransferase [Solirubrobacteraceae bacterium]
MSDDGAARQGSRSAPPLSTRRVRLRTIADHDAAFLYRLMTSPEAGGRVRFAGATPSPEKVAASLWDSVLAQFVVEDVSNHNPLGLVSVTSPNFRDGYAYISAVGSPEVQGAGLFIESVLLCFNYGFATWPFRKIYMEATETSYASFKSGLGRLFNEEGRLREHSYWNGRYVDLLILAVYRATWTANVGLLDRLRDGARHDAARRGIPG